MTIFKTHFVLNGEEIPVYRLVLNKWLNKIGAELPDNSSRERKFVEELIQNTYDVRGGDAESVEEYLRLEVILPLFDVMDDEQSETEALMVAKRSKGESGAVEHYRLELLETVIGKIRNLKMSSTYTPPTK